MRLVMPRGAKQENYIVRSLISDVFREKKAALGHAAQQGEAEKIRF